MSTSTSTSTSILSSRLRRALTAAPLALGLLAGVSAPAAHAQGVRPVVTPTVARTPSALPPGIYVSVTDGAILLGNPGGSQIVNAGQFGFTPSFTQPPVVLPTNPGLQFTPPPVFNASTPVAPTSTASSKSNNVDCEVR